MSHELPTDRLSTTDTSGKRIYLYPADVKGKWRTRRTWVSGVLVVIFLVLPWIRINGHQALLLDIRKGMFAVFGLTFWAHDAPLLLFVFGGGAILLAFVTAIWGRVWCGWACPQTVFVDGLFRKIERWIEGDGFTRRKLDQSPLSLDKFRKKSLKWALFTILGLVISHSFLAYFVGTADLSRMMAKSPVESPHIFLFMIGITGLILFDFGWFREQFCTIVCPYGRFQSVLMDQNSMVVGYDQMRGEPRKGSDTNGSFGDCVNCYRCVQVCPTGIDIRRGTQLECIACTACIDACDEVMVRTKRPVGLIKYMSLSKSNMTVRAWIYGFIVIIAGIGLAVKIQTRKNIETTWIRAVGMPYEVLNSSDSEVEIVNHFKIDIRNQSFSDFQISYQSNQATQEQPEHPEQKNKFVRVITPVREITVRAGQAEKLDIFIRFPKTLLNSGHATVVIRGESKSLAHPDSESVALLEEVRLVGPFQ